MKANALRVGDIVLASCNKGKDIVLEFQEVLELQGEFRPDILQFRLSNSYLIIHERAEVEVETC